MKESMPRPNPLKVAKDLRHQANRQIFTGLYKGERIIQGIVPRKNGKPRG